MKRRTTVFSNAMQINEPDEIQKYDTQMLTTHHGTKRLENRKVFTASGQHMSTTNAMQDRVMQCLNETANKGTNKHHTNGKNLKYFK